MFAKQQSTTEAKSESPTVSGSEEATFDSFPPGDRRCRALRLSRCQLSRGRDYCKRERVIKKVAGRWPSHGQGTKRDRKSRRCVDRPEYEVQVTLRRDLPGGRMWETGVHSGVGVSVVEY